MNRPNFFPPRVSVRPWVQFIIVLAAFSRVPQAAAWTDALTAGSSPIRKVHIDELRTAINNKRANFNMSAQSWTDPAITAGATLIRKVHLDEMRTAINAVRTNYNDDCPAVIPAAVNWTDSTVTAGSTLIRATHITELRNAVDAMGTCASCCPAGSCKTGTCTGTGCGVRASGDEGSPACGVCQDCDGAGNCGNVAFGQTDIGCTSGATACSGADYCSGAGSCAFNHYASGTDCGVCLQCDGAGNCGSVAFNSDPDNDCGTCRVCNGSGSCTAAGWGSDPKSNCTLNYAPYCHLGYCDGAGNCASNPITCYSDGDGDGYGAGSPTTYCGSCPWGYVQNATDCNDLSWNNGSQYYPGNTGWYNDSGDHNCSGAVELSAATKVSGSQVGGCTWVCFEGDCNWVCSYYYSQSWGSSCGGSTDFWTAEAAASSGDCGVAKASQGYQTMYVYWNYEGSSSCLSSSANYLAGSTIQCR